MCRLFATTDTLLFLYNLPTLQSILGGEGLSLQLRHLCSYLIWYCSHHLAANTDLLHEVVLMIGNFVVLNTDNQVIASGWEKSVLFKNFCFSSDFATVRTATDCRTAAVLAAL